MSRWAVSGLVAACVLIVTIGAIVAADRHGDWRDLEARATIAQSEIELLRARVLSTDDRQASTTAAIEEIRAASAATAAELASLDEEIARERDAAALLLTAARRRNSELDDLRGDATKVSTLTQALAVETSALRSCADGLAETFAAVDAGDRERALRSLRDAVPRCAQARRDVSGVLWPFDFPDPHLIAVPGGYYAYATNASAGAVQTLFSADLRTWELRPSALLSLPSWASPGRTWAPAVTESANGYTMYVTLRDQESGRQCISVATAADPGGPFVDESSGPMICNGEGSIDPSPYFDATGAPWLAWSEGGATTPAKILAARLGADGRTTEGEPAVLVEADQAWETGIVEAPSMVLAHGRLVLLYSGARWTGDDYAVGWAVCSAPAGPCEKPDDGPLLHTTELATGPGGQSVLWGHDGALWIAYHAFSPPDVGYPSSRTLRIAPLTLDGDVAFVGQPLRADR